MYVVVCMIHDEFSKYEREYVALKVPFIDIFSGLINGRDKNAKFQMNRRLTNFFSEESIYIVDPCRTRARELLQSTQW